MMNGFFMLGNVKEIKRSKKKKVARPGVGINGVSFFGKIWAQGNANGMAL